MRRKFPRDFKVSVLRRLEDGDSVGEIARFYSIDPNVLRRWRRDYERAPDSAFPGPGRRPGERGIAELQRRIEQHAQEIDYLKHRIRSTEAQLKPLAKSMGV
jgi:transposase-like protein